MRSAEYNHANKVGNQGDLIKHFTLSLVAGDAELRRGAESFHYVETHAGRSEYLLDAKKLSDGWGAGVGRFLEQIHESGNQYVDSSKMLIDQLHKFASTVSFSQGRGSIRYFGSSGLFLTTLEERDVPCGSVLFDTNPDVCSELRSRNNEKNIIICESGYKGVRQLDQIDLLFVDPPDLKPAPDGQFREWKDLIFYCINQEIPFVSWNPLYGRPTDTDEIPSQQSFECGIVEELARIQKLGYLSIRWSDWSEKMCGCQMLFNIVGGSLYVEQCNKLALMMGWKIEA
ncbi:MAG: hypothetical protein HOL17_06095 [Gammaproteobacteria bacterium]|jgi:hypothetical protein|nr:hypothetical protein [Thiotrichales bacterium]MBT5371278.1 hypothetical protein [Gammaproteobacteria bacterium]MBT5466476.1 hypothetical protein [Candidatus Neomarinimicrobiota bacterium]MBT7831664.1 hypothetical protein [Candidatus Neomarinimicrobiota bacterium]